MGCLLLVVSIALQGCGDNPPESPTATSSTGTVVPTSTVQTTSREPTITTTSATAKATSCPVFAGTTSGAPHVDSVTLVGQSATTICAVGHEGNTVVCTDAGVFNPTPNCTVVEDYCLARNSKNVRVPDARLGQTVQVECTAKDYVPVHAETVCKVRGVWDPRPECAIATSTTTTGARRVLRGMA